jgi:hypothetical protein
MDMTEPVSETSRSYTLLAAPVRVEGSSLPQVPKRVFLAAEALGWTPRAWLTVGVFGPAFYAANAAENSGKLHSKGDVKSLGYEAKMYLVEAREAKAPLGFQASFTGKRLSDGKVQGQGTFDFAHVVDPVGIPVVADHKYRPIKQLRGDYETDGSFMDRVTFSEQRAHRMSDEYSDGTESLLPEHYFTETKAFEAWLAEWRSYLTPTKKEAPVG